MKGLVTLKEEEETQEFPGLCGSKAIALTTP